MESRLVLGFAFGVGEGFRVGWVGVGLYYAHVNVSAVST